VTEHGGPIPASFSFSFSFSFSSQTLLQHRKKEPRFEIFHHCLVIERLLKRRKRLRQTLQTELVPQQRKYAQVPIPHFDIFVFQPQNKLMEVIN
jgi:hypothetical protein